MKSEIQSYWKALLSLLYQHRCTICKKEMTLEEVSRWMVECYRQYYMRKAPEYFSEPDQFKREYLKRSMHLIMKNSFLTSLMRRYGSGSDFLHMHKPTKSFST